MADVETGAAGGQPSLKRGVSMTGKLANFGDSDAEVERILKNQKNYYYVLKAKKDTPKAEIKANYYKLSRLVHPDKCKHEKAVDAAAVINQAWDTLSNPVKKTAYDMYVDDVAVDAPEGMTYAEWEASNAMQQVRIPKWLETVLRIPGAGIILALILLPLTLVLVLLIIVVSIVLNLLCLPLRCLGCCRPPPPGAEGGPGFEDATKAQGGLTQEEAMAEMAARNAAARRAAGQAPAQQPAPEV